MEKQKINVQHQELRNVISDLERGRLKIPRFQRNFIWEKSKVTKLLDSIYKEFPIGSFFFWQADKKYNKFFRDIPELDFPKPEKFSELNFILDGQQRITSLYLSMEGKKIGTVDYGQLCFDLDEEKFVFRKESSRYIPLYKILSSEYLFLLTTLNEKRKKNFLKCNIGFHKYPLSIVTVLEKELDDAIEIFERINQGGKRLSLFDLVAGSTWGEDFDLRQEYQELETYLNGKGFGRINPEVMMQTAGLILKGSTRKRALLDIKKDEIAPRWKDLRNSIEQAVDYMRSNLGISIFQFTPYPNMIAQLAYLFYNSKSKSLNSNSKRLVDTWFWQSALSERYTAYRDTAMEEDKKKIFDPILKGDDCKINFPLTLTIEKLKSAKIGTKSALRNAFFCMLAKKHPEHFKNNTQILLDYTLCSQYHNSEKHHIFPRAFLKEQGHDGINKILNFCFIPAELNKEITKKSPSDYFTRYAGENPRFEDALKTHLIPNGSFIENDDFDKFLDARAELVFEEFEHLVGNEILQKMGEYKSQVISELEKKLRDLIDRELIKKEGSDYFKKAVPGAVQENINKKYKSHLKNNPKAQTTELNPRFLLDFCDMTDYCSLMFNNWSLFEERFGSRNELQKRFDNLIKLRNVIMHNRQIDSVTRKEGEAAIEWIDSAIS